MMRWVAIAVAAVLVAQDPAGDIDAQAKELDAQLAKAAEKTAEDLIKLKSFDEARAFLDVVRTKSDSNAEALEKVYAKAKGTSKELWSRETISKLKDFGKDQSQHAFSFCRKWKAKQPDRARWAEAYAELLTDIPDYVQLIHRINSCRLQSGVPRTSYDWTISAAALWHAKYIIANPNDDSEIEGKEGFTPEGKECVHTSICNRSKSAKALVNEIMDGPFDINYILRPAMRRVGLAQASSSDVASVIDVEKGVEGMDETQFIVAYPGDKAAGVPTRGNENSLQVVRERRNEDMGFPISLIFYSADSKITDVTAALYDAGQKEVSVLISTPERPAIPDKYGNNKNTILVIPDKPLKATSSYRIKIKYSDRGQAKEQSWTFTTGR